MRLPLDGDPAAWGTLLGWLFTHALGKLVGGPDPEAPDQDHAGQSRSLMDEWLLGKLVAGALQDLGLDQAAAWWAVGTIKILINHQDWHQLQVPDTGSPPAGEGQAGTAPATSAGAQAERAYATLVSWLRDPEVQQFVQVNRYGGLLWFNHEAFDQLLRWMLAVAAVDITANAERSQDEIARDLAACYDIVQRLKQAEESSEYQVVKLMEAAKG